MVFEHILHCYLSCLAGAPGRKKKAPKVAAHILVDPENACWQYVGLPTASKIDPDWSFASPFVLTQAAQCFASEDVANNLKSFHALFKESSMRVTEGRAQAPAKPEAGSAFAQALQQCLGGKMTVQLEPEQASEWPDLARMRGCFTYGIAASHVSIAKLELNMFPCLRAGFQGSRFVTAASLTAITQHLSQQQGDGKPTTLQHVQDFLFNCSQSEVDALCGAHGLFAGTVGPNDVLYMPPGCLLSHRVNSNDICGLRIGAVSPSMSDGIDAVQAVSPDNKALQQAKLLIAQMPGKLAENQAEPQAC